ncbi:ATP-binding protein, partial [Streptomyces silaceus]|uniref:ATP-binding protein n=1 Tax=Streptomyces silaceus TaxID=545123 RepID=UPI0006EBA58C
PAAATESPVAEPTSALRTPAAKASAPPVPRQLPAPTAAFTGRLDELAELDRALAECAGGDATGVRAGGRVSDRAVAPAGAQTGGTVVISAIGGTGGIGKSWLALRWAHHNADRFPDGQLYVNLRGFDPSSPPLPPDAAVRQLLEALGVDRDAVPGDPEATIALYRSVVAGKRLLVVLDDARDADQVDPLLPGTSSCTVLVTSRNRLLPLAARHGAGLLHLDVFDEADAHALLLRHLGERRVAAEPEAVGVIVECCAGLPLALGIAAARAVSHPDFPLSVLAGELREATGRLDALDIGGLTANLRGAFAASRRALTEPARQLFGLLGIAPGPDISLDAAASLAGGTVASVRKPLAELEAAHLVDQWSPGRYRMHDLVRLYAAEPGVAPEDRTAPLTRVTDFYLHSAFAANRQLDGPDTPFRPTLAAPAEGCLPREPTDGRAALDWFTAEHACLVAAQRTALAGGRLPVVWQLAWTLISFHLGGHQLRDYEGVWHNALTAADRFVGEAGPRTLATWRLGHARALEGRSAEALEHLDVALALAEESGDSAGQAHISRTIAWVWERKGDCPRALDHAARALALYASVGNTTWEANQLNAVGWLCAQLGRYDEALTHCEQALDLFRGAAHPGAEASTLDSLGYINHHTGRWERAVAYYEEALDLFTSLGDTYDQADTLANLADTQDAMGRADLARATRLRALDLYRAQNREAGVDRMREHLG